MEKKLIENMIQIKIKKFKKIFTIISKNKIFVFRSLRKKRCFPVKIDKINKGVIEK